MRRLLVLIAVIAAIIFGVLFFLPEQSTDAPPAPDTATSTPVFDPKHATYRIEGVEYDLRDGVFEDGGVRVALFGEPTMGDIDGDYDDDAAFLLVFEPGGSGTFFYAAAALRERDSYRGTNAVFIGDRIAPQTIAITNRVIMANFAERAPGEPMTADPSVGTSAYLTVERGELVRKAPVLPKGAQVLQGYVTWGGEVRVFRPCGEAQPEYWIMGDSNALNAIKETHERIANTAAYIPFFATVSGEIVPAPQDGFGADYDYGIRVHDLVYADRIASCLSDTVVLTSPLSGNTVSSPVTLTGYVRGSWAFEGDFPVTMVDWDGRIIAEGYASTLSDWMTEDYVPFLGTLEFTSPAYEDASYSRRGAIILQKDNASGIPEMEEALEVPVRFE